MSNPNSPISEANLMAYIYEDVDDADIFGLTSAAHPFNNPSSESKNDEGAEPPIEVSELLKEQSSLKDQLKQVQTEKELLEVSVSQLYRTAKAEIARKDRRILELTQKLDSVVFRRRNNNRNPLEDGPGKSQEQKEFYTAECNTNSTKRKEHDNLGSESRQNDEPPKRVIQSGDNVPLNGCLVKKGSNSALSSAHVPKLIDIQRNLPPRSRSATKTSSDDSKLIDQVADVKIDSQPVVNSENSTKIKSEIVNKCHQIEPCNHQPVSEKDAGLHLKSDYKIPKNKNRETDKTHENLKNECNKELDGNQSQKSSILCSEKSVLCNTDTDASGKLAPTARTTRTIKEPIRRSRRNSEHVPRPPRTPSGSPPRDSSERSPGRTHSRERFDRFSSQRQSSRSNNYQENTYTKTTKTHHGSNTLQSRRPQRSRSMEKHERSSKPEKKSSCDPERAMSRSKFRYTDRRDFNLRSKFSSREGFCLRDRRRLDYKGGSRRGRSSSSERGAKRDAGREFVETYRDWRKRNSERNSTEFPSDQPKSSLANQHEGGIKRAQTKKSNLKETLRKDYETDFSDWDDFRLHLSPSSDDTVVYHNQHSRASSIARGKFGVDVEHMDLEDLEKAVMRKQKELEEMEIKLPGPDYAEVSKISKNNAANENNEMLAEDEKSSKSVTFLPPREDQAAECHSKDRKLRDFAGKVASKSPVHDAGLPQAWKSLDVKANKCNSSLKRSGKSKPEIELPKELYTVLVDENFEAKSKSCKPKHESSYKSLIVKIQEIKQEQINFRLNHDGKPKSNEITDDNPKENMPSAAGDSENPSAPLNAETNCPEDVIANSEDKKKIDLNTYKKRVNVKADVHQDIPVQNSNLLKEHIRSPEHEASTDDSAETIICPNELQNAQFDAQIDKCFKSSVDQSKEAESCTQENGQFDTLGGFEEEIVEHNESLGGILPVVRATSQCEEKPCDSPKSTEKESQDLTSFIHDFSLSDDEVRFSETKGLRDGAVARDHNPVNKINILEVSIVRPGSGNVFKTIPEKVQPVQDSETTPIDPPVSQNEKLDTFNVQLECIESIKEAIQNNDLAEEESLCVDRLKYDESSKLDTEQLQRCLEDDVCGESEELNETKMASCSSFGAFGVDNATDQDSKHDSNENIDFARRSCTPPNLTRKTRVQEQMLRLFGSESKSESDAVPKRLDKVKKNLTKMAQEKQPADQLKIKASKKKAADEILFRILQKQGLSGLNVDQNKRLPQSAHLKKSSYSAFCNNPNYIPNPSDIDFRIEKQEEIELEICKNLDKSLEKQVRNVKAQKAKTPAGTKAARKRKSAENCIKIKMSFNSPPKNRKKLEDSTDSDQKKRKKASKRSRVIDSDSSEDEQKTESASGKESLKKRPKSEDTVQNQNSCNKSATEATAIKVNESHKDNVEMPTKSETVSAHSRLDAVPEQTDESCTKKEITCAVNTKHAINSDQLNETRNKAVFKTHTPRRITPVKIGEASFSKNKKVNDSNEYTVAENEQFVKANQSPLPHMEEMLKKYANKSIDVREALINTQDSIKGASHVYAKNPSITRPTSSTQETTNYPEVNQINLDSKDISMLGTVERVIFDNMTAYLVDKSLPTFERQTGGKTTLRAAEEPKESTSPLDFSNMLRKSLNTSTPIKPQKAGENDKVHPQTSCISQTSMANLPAVKDVLSDSSKSYISSPLKRERRRRVKILTGIM